MGLTEPTSAGMTEVVWDHEGGGSCAIKERTLSAEPEPFKLV